MKLTKMIETQLHKERIIIGIDGPSGSGKSTLSKALEDQYDALVIHIDDYFLPKSMKTTERLHEIGGNFHYERFLKEIIPNLDQNTIPYNKFNCMDESLHKLIVDNKRIVVIEGCYSLHPLLREYYDIKVVMNIPRDIQLSRIKERSGEHLYQRFVNEWIPLEDKYFNEGKIASIADIIINNY